MSTFEQVQQQIVNYLQKLRHPNKLSSSRIFKYFQKIPLPKHIQNALDTRAKSLGSYITVHARCDSGEVKKGPIYCIRILDEVCTSIKKHMKEYRQDHQDSLQLMVNELHITIDKLHALTATTGDDVYCLLCFWRLPAAGQPTMYCNEHRLENIDEPGSKKKRYETANYQSAKRWLARAADKHAKNLALQALSTHVRIKMKDYLSKNYPATSIKAFNKICASDLKLLHLQSNSPSTLITPRMAWGEGEQWREHAKNIVAFIHENPFLLKILDEEKFAAVNSLDEWLESLSRVMSGESEFDSTTISPFELMGCLSRYAQYMVIDEAMAATPFRSTTPKPELHREVALLRNQGYKYSEVGKKLGISTQRAHAIYHKV
jgi:hypothetical protein